MTIRGTQNSLGNANLVNPRCNWCDPLCLTGPRAHLHGSLQSPAVKDHTTAGAMFAAVGAALHERAYDVICNRACKEPDQPHQRNDRFDNTRLAPAGERDGADRRGGVARSCAIESIATQLRPSVLAEHRLPSMSVAARAWKASSPQHADYLR
jgi:hypothetical protein